MFIRYSPITQQIVQAAVSAPANTTFYLRVEIRDGYEIQTGEIFDCSREVEFGILNGRQPQLLFSKKTNGIKYDSARERDQDRGETLDQLLADCCAFIPRFQYNNRDRFYSENPHLSLPQRTMNPSLDAGVLRSWLHDFYNNNRLKKPEGMCKMRFAVLQALFTELQDLYGFNVRDIWGHQKLF